MTVACPDCGRQLAPDDRGTAACYNCNEQFELGQCEGCGDVRLTADLTAETVPGATLSWCSDCRTTRGLEA